MAKKKAKSKAGIYIIIGLLIIAGTYFYKGTSKENTSIPDSTVSQEVDKDKQPDTNTSAEDKNQDKSENQKPANNEPKKNTLPPIPVQETDDRVGEFKVEGIVQAVNENQQVITIEQILDDNTPKIDPAVKVSKKAIIQNSNGKVKLSEIQIGATVNLIITKNGYARSVTVVE